MADSSDDEVYVPWWDRTPTGSSSDDDGDSSDETETESEVYSLDEEWFYDYEHAYEEALEHYIRAYAFFFDDELYDEFDADNEDEDEDDDDDDVSSSSDDNDDGAEQKNFRLSKFLF